MLQIVDVVLLTFFVRRMFDQPEIQNNLPTKNVSQTSPINMQATCFNIVYQQIPYNNVRTCNLGFRNIQLNKHNIIKKLNM